MSKVEIIGDRIEFNGFLIGRTTKSLAQSVKRDFERYVGGMDQRIYDRGYAAGVEAEKNFQRMEGAL